jgi:hypothetical protein
MTLTPQLQQIISIGAMALAALLCVVVIFRPRSKPKPPAEDPATPVQPFHSEVVIHPPQTFTELNGFRFREDTLLDFSPNENLVCGTYRRVGIFGIPYDDRAGFGGTGQFQGGAQIRVRLWMDAWKENPYEAPARYDTLYTWNAEKADLVPLGEDWTDTPHIRYFPGCAGSEPHGGYAPGPRGCNQPPPFVPGQQQGVGHAGKLMVDVRYLGQITSAEFPILVWIAPCR